MGKREMGVRGLMLYCRRIQRRVDIRHKGLNIGIDAFSLIFLFREDRRSFVLYLQGLKDMEHTITFIMDKRAQKEKKEVVNERKEIRKDAKADATQLTTFTQTDEYEELDEQQQRILNKFIALKQRDAWCLYPEYVKWLKGAIEELGISFVIAEEEADTVLARNSYDAVISSDSDLLILGVKSLWIPRANSLYITEILREDFLDLLGLEGEQLYQLAFLCGCDIQPRKIVDIQSAISLLRFYGSIYRIFERVPSVLSSDDIELYKRLRQTAWEMTI